MNQPPESGQDILEFIQARPVLDRFPPIPFDANWGKGEGFLLSASGTLGEPEADGSAAEEKNACVETEVDSDVMMNVRECEHDELRRYLTPVAVYRGAITNTFFEPSRRNAILYNRFMEPIKQFVSEWWDKIEDSRKFEQNRQLIERYHRTLHPGSATLAGLVCEGGQGMRTANNGRFLGYLEGTPQAQTILDRRRVLETRWQDDQNVAPVYRHLKTRASDFPELADALKGHFSGEQSWTSVLGFKRGEIYRIVPHILLFNIDDLTERQRQQIIRSGIEGERCWVLFRKGDPEGNK